MPYDYALLNGKIVEKFGTRYNFAKAMGISERSLSLKMNGERSWKQPQISKAIELLEISEKDMHSYFVTLKVQ